MFSPADVVRGRGRIEAFARTLKTMQKMMEPEFSESVTIAAGATGTLYSATEAGCISNLFLQAPSKKDLSVLTFEAAWDANPQPAIRTPLHLLAGVSRELEDYFGFAWCYVLAFHHPYRGQTAIIPGKTERMTSMHRYHLLDQLPFQRFAFFQTETLGTAEGNMDYESLILYYRAP